MKNVNVSYVSLYCTYENMKIKSVVLLSCLSGKYVQFRALLAEGWNFSCFLFLTGVV